MYKIRKWSVTNARKLEAVYRNFEPLLMKLHPLFKTLGYGRLEKPVRVIEKTIKGVMFDCKMCGRCLLGTTGMSCSMNCPKSIMDGHCEVKPEMRCVWVEAWRGSQQMRNSEAIRQVQIPVNHLLEGSSSWLRVVQEDHAARISEAAQ